MSVILAEYLRKSVSILDTMCIVLVTFQRVTFH